MQLILALLWKCNSSVESQKVNNKGEGLWCVLMRGVKIMALEDRPWRTDIFRILNTAHLKSCGYE